MNAFGPRSPFFGLRGRPCRSRLAFGNDRARRTLFKSASFPVRSHRPEPETSALGDQRPIREELFGAERLEQHARSLAAAQPVTSRPPKVPHLNGRLKENVAVLLSAYRKTAGDAEGGRPIVPAAEWLLDNYHLVEEQVREIRDDLPIGYYRQLPKLAGGPLAGYPRVIGLAWAYVAHTDSYFDPRCCDAFLWPINKLSP